MHENDRESIDWKQRAELLAGLLDCARIEARRYRHLCLLARPHPDGWRIELPGDMPFELAVDTDVHTKALLGRLQRRSPRRSDGS